MNADQAKKPMNDKSYEVAREWLHSNGFYRLPEHTFTELCYIFNAGRAYSDKHDDCIKEILRLQKKISDQEDTIYHETRSLAGEKYVLMKKLEIATDALDEIQHMTLSGLRMDAAEGHVNDWKMEASRALNKIEKLNKNG